MDVACSFKRRGIHRPNFFRAKTREQRFGKPVPSRQVRPGFALGNEQPVFTQDALHLLRRKPEELLSAERHHSLEPHTLALRPHKELEPVTVDTHEPNLPPALSAGARRGGITAEQLLPRTPRTCTAQRRFDHLPEPGT